MMKSLNLSTSISSWNFLLSSTGTDPMRKKVRLNLLPWFLIWLLTRFRNSKWNGLDFTNLITFSSGQGGADLISNSHGFGFVEFHI